MTFFGLLTLLGGVGLFLYGMSVMGAGLEKIAGGKTESILKKLTSSIFRGVLLGTVVTAIIQSSSATTVIVIGLVNSGIMKFTQALGIIMGANIGTTVTGQIIRLSDLSSDNFFVKLVKPSSLAPMSIIAGIVLTMFFKKAKQKNIGQILLGFGVLFIGMLTMESSVAPLKDSPLFLELFSKFQNPFLGVLVGTVVTGIIQSSSASIGILQALTSTSAVTWAIAVPIILGQNIGTCVTGLIASIGASRSAKRVAFSHVYFNLIGTAIFLIAIYSLKALVNIPFWHNAMNMGDIANFHTLFNIATTLIFLPFSGLLAKLSYKTVPEDEEERHPELDVIVLDERLYASPSMAIAHARSAVAGMAELAAMIQKKALSIMMTNDLEEMDLANKRENLIDSLEVSITNYLVGIAKLDLTEDEGLQAATLISFINEFERIGDRAINIIQRAGEMTDKRISFSEEAVTEIKILDSAVNEVCGLAIDAFKNHSTDSAERVEPLEETVDEIVETIHDRHILRLKDGSCSIEAGVVFLEALNNYERVSDHCSNVAAKILSSIQPMPDPHTLLRELHEGHQEVYMKLLSEYEKKYALPAFERAKRQQNESKPH
ncbi:MAG: Na/Pi cotransporter family protein [Clostridiales bacterium]|jgi:phosphate:Na+ symporter|nr:Na/Pi cotransporter family protein [Clostridiales bacterium]